MIQMYKGFSLFIFFSLFFSVQGNDTHEHDSQGYHHHDSIQVSEVEIENSDSTESVLKSVEDSLVVPSDSVIPQGSIPTEIKRLQHVRRDFNHRRQVWLGLAMMAFVAVIFSTAQNWNPR